jgi:hypothetical protein
MSRFTKGQRVRVEIEGTVASYHEGGGRHEGMYVTTGNGEQCHYVRLGVAGSPKGTVSVTLLDPPDWPPQVGDIWESEGREYCVRGSNIREGVIIEPFNVANPGPRWQYANELLDDFKGLNPVLVRRRGQ